MRATLPPAMSDLLATLGHDLLDVGHARDDVPGQLSSMRYVAVGETTTPVAFWWRAPVVKSCRLCVDG